MKHHLVDTNIMIDYLRGYPPAIALIESLSDRLSLSTITIAELYAGIRGKDERHNIELLISAFEIISVDQDIAIKAGDYKNTYFKSHQIYLADAMIAATADVFDVILLTLNVKHFPMIKGLKPPYKKH